MKATRLIAIAAVVIAGSATTAAAEADEPSPVEPAPTTTAPADPAPVDPIVLPLDCTGQAEYTQNTSGSWDATYVVDCHGPDLDEGGPEEG